VSSVITVPSEHLKCPVCGEGELILIKPKDSFILYPLVEAIDFNLN
jgi:hypothetical protein